jgi:hypothetical protein
VAINVRVNGGLGRNWSKDIVVQLWRYLPEVLDNVQNRKEDILYRGRLSKQTAP